MTGDKGQVTGDRGQEAGFRGQVTGDRGHVTGDYVDSEDRILETKTGDWRQRTGSDWR